ncbi:hypothetical protein LHYA1_G001884 [Lachnellula hyalina]|uniref:Cell surface protein n=1 Tax=Lachnellula hyalina TaxID=1316788 RepID=A0A8H8U0L4_9HELO|nr:uncharacterized protein LHYA1_G001884 [Lachnellula hyalina]TVY29440.1 hypothetical protein LHYA1_G001884 [Lachnellula hyalina]
MYTKFIIAALVASPLVAAHGKIAVMTGDAGGNTTGLGIQGGVVPGPGSNKETEVDTTVFQSKQAATDGLGKTKAGPNTMADMTAVMAASGSTLPQVSPGGSLAGTVHIVTTDGAGPYTAIVDPTGTGAFSQGTQCDITTQVPGTNGNIAAPKQRRFLPRMLVKMGIVKRASNVNEDYPIAISMPADMACTGTVGGQSGVCLVKIANPSGAGPFGGVVAMQVAGAASGNSTAAAPAKASVAAPQASTGSASNAAGAKAGGAKAAGAGANAAGAKAGKSSKNNRAVVGAKFRA